VFGFARLRYQFWKLFIKKGGNRVFVFSQCRLLSPGGILFGDNVIVNHHTDLDGHGQLNIGSNVMIGPYCMVLTSQHDYHSIEIPIMEQKILLGKVKIGDDVWVGAHSIILPNIVVGQGAVIGANSVVTRDVPSFAVVAGSPAKVIKYRKSN